MRINYLSPVRLTLALLPELIERGGRIVNVSSIAGRLGPGTESAYSATKAAITAWSESLAVDLAVLGTDVRVHVVNPGIIDTELFRLPDNDATIADMAMALPVTDMVEPVVAQLESGTFEIYVPEWFGDVVRGKFENPDAFLEGSAAYLKERLGDRA
jgi:NAD(P)-dependent dehydrogenase (short-subunit alcohol dehydrogenase family)